MASTIVTKNSSTAGAAPTSSDLVQGELAVNVTDKRIYTENASGTVVELGTNPSVPVTFPDGSASAPSLTNDGDTNTGVFFPAADTVGITTGGTERVRVDSSGNVGVGVTPSAWGSAVKWAVELPYGSSISSYNGAPVFYAGSNAYHNGTNWIYKTTATAALYGLNNNNGSHYWYTAASGTAGNAITFTQAMTLDASGNLSIGTTTNDGWKLQVNGSNNAIRFDYSRGSYANIFGYLDHQGDSGGVELGNINDSNDRSIRFTSGTTFAGRTEKARIDSSGNLLVGTASASSLSGNFGLITATGSGQFGHQTGTVTGTQFAIYYYAGSTIGSITQNGTTAVAYNTTSDYRLKENVQPLYGALARVAALKPCTYTWKAAPDEIGEGFIAHELAEVCPQAVTGEKDAVNEDGSIKPQSIDTSFLVATLTAAIQEQQAIIQQLQADVAALKG